MSHRLLCICAHPDDECYAFGGTLALLAARGVETSVLCLTDGQAATNRGVFGSNKALGEGRRREFEASCKALGVAHMEVLDYDDGRVEFEDFNTLAERLIERMREFRPHVVLTFGTDGGLNTHPDHTMASLATTAAFHWAGHPKRFPEAGALWQPQRLYYVSSDFVLPERPRPNLAPWTCTVDITETFPKKLEAFAAHASQAPLMEATKGIFEAHDKVERFTLAATTVPQPARQSTDLFEGVADV